MAKKKSVEMMALEMAVKALWKEWRSGVYCEAEECGNSQGTPTKCGEDDGFCQESIKAHFLKLAKAQGKKEAK